MRIMKASTAIIRRTPSGRPTTFLASDLTTRMPVWLQLGRRARLQINTRPRINLATTVEIDGTNIDVTPSPSHNSDRTSL